MRTGDADRIYRYLVALGLEPQPWQRELLQSIEDQVSCESES